MLYFFYTTHILFICSKHISEVLASLQFLQVNCSYKVRFVSYVCNVGQTN